MIEELLKRFDKFPDIGKLLITNLEVLLEAGMISEAKEFVEYCINGLFFLAHLSTECSVSYCDHFLSIRVHLSVRTNESVLKWLGLARFRVG